MNAPLLPDKTYKLITESVPIVCVDVVPVASDGKIGIITRATGTGNTTSGKGLPALIGGRILINESVPAAIGRHLKTDLGVASFQFLASSPEQQPFYVQQYFKSASVAHHYGFDPGKHAISLNYFVRLEGAPVPAQEAQKFHWISAAELPTETAFNQHVVMRAAFDHLARHGH